MLMIVLLLLLAVWPATEALVCYCDDCVNSDTCEVGAGGMCYIQTFRLPNSPSVQTRRRCYEAAAVSYCGTRRLDQFVVECCNTDMCNREPSTLFNPETDSTVSTYPPPTTVLPTPTNRPEPANSGEGSTKYRCIHHNSNWPEIHSQCTTNTSCYWSVRKKNSGEVVFKQGCSSESNPCVQTLRNREAIFCCNGSLCNDVESPIKSSNSTPICGNYSKPNVEPSVTGFTNITEEPGTGTNSRTQTEASITPSFTVEKISTNNEGSGNSLGKNEENLRSWLCSTSTLTSCSQHSQTLIVTITATITTTRTVHRQGYTDSVQTVVPTTGSNHLIRIEEPMGMCLAFTGVGVLLLITSTISMFVTCACMKYCSHNTPQHKHHHHNSIMKIPDHTFSTSNIYTYTSTTV